MAPTPGRSSIGVRVRPNADQFIRQLREQMAAKRYTFYADVGARMNQANTDLQQWGKTVLPAMRFNIPLNANMKPANKTVADWRAKQRNNTTLIPMGVNLAAANRDITVFRQAASRAIVINVQSDVGRALTKAEAARATINRSKATIDVEADVSRVDPRQLGLFSDEGLKVDVDMNVAAAKMEAFNREYAELKMEGELALADARLEAANFKAGLEHQRIVLPVHINTDGTKKKLSELRKEYDALHKVMDLGNQEAQLQQQKNATDEMFRSRALRQANLERELRAKLNTRNADLELLQLKAGLEANTVEIPVNVDPDTGKARMSLDALAFEYRKLNMEVDVRTLEARAELARLKASAERDKIRIGMDVDSKRLADLRRLLGSFGRARINLGPLSLGKGSGVAGNVTSIGALAYTVPAAVTAVAGLSDALVRLSGAAALVPGAIAAVGTSVGVLMVGIKPVTEAIGAMFDLWNEGSSATQSQAKAAASAHTSLRNAVVDEAKAQEDVAKARRDATRELRDQNNELRRSTLNEAQAILAVQKAADTLYRGGFDNETERVEAQLGYASAQQDLIEVRERNVRLQADAAEAADKGVDGSDRVTDAVEAQTRATQALVQAQQAILDTNSAGATEKLADAMARLAPEATAFVDAFAGARDLFKGLNTEITESIFTDSGANLTAFFEQLEPTLRPGVLKVAQALNGTLLEGMEVIGGPEGRSIIERILGGSAETQQAVTKLLDPLINGVGTLMAAGAEKTPKLIDLFTTFAERFEGFIKRVDADGSLDTFFDNGIKSLGNLVDIGTNLSQVLFDMHEAFGGDLLKSIADMTGRWHEFLSSTKGQNAVKEYIDDFKRGVDLVWPVLTDLVDILGAASEGAQLFLAIALPAINVVTSVLAGLEPLIAGVLAGFLSWKGAQIAFNALDVGIKGVQGFVGNFRDNVSKTGDKVRGLIGSGGAFGMMAVFFGGTLAKVLADAGGDMDRYANHINAAKDAAADLKNTLEDVTGLFSQRTRQDVAEVLASGQKPSGAGDFFLPGSAIGAAGQLGIGGRGGADLVNAVLPGGEGLFNQYQDAALGKARPVIEKYLNSQGVDVVGALRDAGVSVDDVTKATLGDTAAVDKVQKALADERARVDSAGSAGEVLLNAIGGFFGQDWGHNADQRMSLEAFSSQLAGAGSDVTNSALVAQRLNWLKFGTDSAARQFSEVRDAATPQPTLKPEFAAAFPGATVQSDGSSSTILINGAPTDAQKAAAGDSATEVIQGGAPGGGLDPNQWTWRLSEEDARKLLQFNAGGYTDWPISTGKLAMVHGKEYVQPADTVGYYGKDAMEAIHHKRVPPAFLRGFEGGGGVGDGVLLDPLTGQPIKVDDGALQAPADTGGGITSVVQHGLAAASHMANNLPGAMGPTGPAPGPVQTNIFGGPTGTLPGPGTALPGLGEQPAPYSGGTAGTSITIPGIGIPITIGGEGEQTDPLSGLKRLSDPTVWPFGVPGIGKPGTTKDDASDWIADFAQTTATKAFDAVFVQGFLGFFGAEGLVNNKYMGLAKGAMSHLGGLNTDLAKTAQAPGADEANAAALANLQTYYGMPVNGASGAPDLNATLANLGGGIGDGHTGSEGGLQVKTIAIKRVLEGLFPSVKRIGGYRQDNLEWHPNGRALDVMVSELGNNDPTPPSAKALGDAIYAWAVGPQGQAMGVYPAGTLWQQKDHYNHVHVALLDGGGYPGGSGPSTQDSSGAAAGPKDAGGGPTIKPSGAASPNPSRVYNNAAEAWKTMSPEQRAAGVANGRFRPDGTPIGLNDPKSTPAPAKSPITDLFAPPKPGPTPAAGKTPLDDLIKGRLPEFTRDQGGWLPPGRSIVNNFTGKDELVLTNEQAKGFFGGGPMLPTAMIPIPKPPPTPPVQAQPKIAQPVAPPPVVAQGPSSAPPIAQPLPPSVPPPDLPGAAGPGNLAPPAPSAPNAQPGAQPATPGVIPAQIGPGEGPGAGPSHLHPAVQKGIQSGAATIGALADMAVAAAAMGATMGMAGPAAGAVAGGGGGGLGGGLGGLGGGLSASGIIKQGGKIVEGIANVGASFLVGTATNGTTDNAYGVTQRGSNPRGNSIVDRSTKYGDVYTYDHDEFFARSRREADQRAQGGLGRFASVG